MSWIIKRFSYLKQLIPKNSRNLWKNMNFWIGCFQQRSNRVGNWQIMYVIAIWHIFIDVLWRFKFKEN